MMQLFELLSPWVQLTLPWNQLNESYEIENITLDSRKASNGCLFVAIKGHQVDGRQFISSAIKNGASAVIAQADELASFDKHGKVTVVNNVPIIYIDELSGKVSAIAGRFYRLHNANMKIVGITGTNGKTTISQIIAQWATLLDTKAGVMGTTGNGLLMDLKPALNTTGSPIEIQQTLSQLEKIGVELTALEVSSHGLIQDRVKGLVFDAAVFTNLSRDHLDYHGDMENYAKAKKLLFTSHSPKQVIINGDDDVGISWLKEWPNAVGVSLESNQLKEHVGKKVIATSVSYSEQGIALSVISDWGETQFSVPLIGSFNANNTLVAFTTLLTLGYDIEKLSQTAKNLTAVVGRMELFQTSNRAKLVVDYAHTPDALEKALKALRIHCRGKLWVIFGCGGDRDKGKRPMMANVAEKYSDVVIVVDDNPRSEDPKDIIQDILTGFSSPNEVIAIHDRFEACQFALEQSSKQDIILIAGKGHENYQILANETIHYSDRETAQQLLGLTS